MRDIPAFDVSRADTADFRMPADPSSAHAMDDVIARCLDGDQAAWDTIVRQHWRRVFNIAYKFVGRHDQAEDLTQDVFLKLYRSLDTFDRRANFQTWLVSVSRNLCIDHYPQRPQGARGDQPRRRSERADAGGAGS